MVQAVRGRGGDFIARYDGSGGAPSFGPSGEDNLGAGGAGGVEDDYFPPSAGRVHGLFSKSSPVFSGSRAMMGCGAPAGGVGAPVSGPSEVENLTPAEPPPQDKEKTPCEIVLNALDAGVFGVVRVVTTHEETGYFMEGKETISPDQLHFRLIPAKIDYGNYPFKEGHKIHLVYTSGQSPQDGTVCKNSSINPKTNQIIAERAHNFLTRQGNIFEVARGTLLSVGDWKKARDRAGREVWMKYFGSELEALLAVFMDKRLAQELSVSPVDVSGNDGREEIEILWRRFIDVGIEVDDNTPERGRYFAIFPHILDLAADKGPRFFAFFEEEENCDPKINCLSFVHNYNEDLNFYYLGRNRKVPREYRFTLTEEKIVEGHQFPKGSQVSWSYWKGTKGGFIKRMVVTLSRNTRIEDILFHKGTELKFIGGKLYEAFLESNHIIKGKRFSAGSSIGFDEKGRADELAESLPPTGAILR